MRRSSSLAATLLGLVACGPSVVRRQTATRATHTLPLLPPPEAPVSTGFLVPHKHLSLEGGMALVRQPGTQYARGKGIRPLLIPRFQGGGRVAYGLNDVFELALAWRFAPSLGALPTTLAVEQGVDLGGFSHRLVSAM